MKKFRRLAALLLCALVLGTACSKDGGNDTENGANAEEIAKTEVLTNVFRGTGIALPEDYNISDGVKPYYNAETGEMTILCMHGYESDVVNEYGYNEYIRETVLLTVDSSNTIVKEQKLELGDNVYINSGVLTADKLYYIHNRYDEAAMKDSFHAAVCNLADGTVTMSDDVKGLFAQTGDDWFYLQYLAVDADGYLYLAADQEIVVLNDAFVKQFSVMSQNWINELTAAADGTVWAAGYFDSGYGFVPVDKNTKSFGKTVELPANLNAQQYLFADGYDVYLSADDGLYGYNFTEEAAVPELVFSYANSDLHGNSVEVARVLGPDCVILYEQDPETYDRYPAVYNRSADIDLSQVKVLEIAFTNSEWNLASSIVKFNKANDGVRIIAKDYSQYNTDEDYAAGSKKLVNDILLGLYKPDMVTGYSASEDVVSQIYANGLYADLYPLMEADGTIAKDDLLGCVTRTFETDDGKLWALGNSLNVQTLMGTKEMLGDRTGWTLSEMIDFAESLPEGTQLMRGLTQQSAVYSLLGVNGYGMFVDMEANTCNFEQENFINYLEYLATLPATNKPANRAEAEAMAAVSSGEDRYLAYHNGQIVLKNVYYSGVNDWVRREAEFNTPDVVDIGYPTADGSNGTRVDMTPYVITSFCEYPEEAWDFIESMIAPEEDFDSRVLGRHGIPVLKEQFMQVCESEYDSLFEIYFDGGMSWGPYDPEYDDLEAEMREPGIRKFFTEEDAQAMLRWLDEEVGAPAADAVDPEITEIVTEEITSYLGGAKTAADCARIIQSRVSIWLAEHE